MDDDARSNLYQVFNALKDRKTRLLSPDMVLDMQYEFAGMYNYSPVIHPDFLHKMVHPHRGYMAYYKGGWSCEEIIDVMDVMLVATFEKLLGQELLANEIASFAFWRKARGEDSGWMDLAHFCSLLQSMRFNDIKTPEDMKKEFKFALSLEPNQNLVTERLVNFDFYKYIFLERNL